ncbi:Lupus La protein [Artemisia annua]|uniref:Lupus La protein n=1 Tax=Artemisia annua TaxID=35608 RepID=A0A2U1QKT7_ARTAN|nr:Lupus La protein [Artemisia annua]
MHVECYPGDENLRTDKFLLKYLAKDEQGYIPIGVIASFRKMKKLTTHKSLVVAALKESSILLCSMHCSGRESPRGAHDIEHEEDICIKKITIHEGNATRGGKCSTEEKLLSGKERYIDDLHKCHLLFKPYKQERVVLGLPKNQPYKQERVVLGLPKNQLHAVVEYQTVEAAENTAATLNNDQDRCYGIRAKLLKGRVKNAERKKGHDSEKKSNVQTDLPGDKEGQQSSEHHDDTPNGEYVAKDVDSVTSEYGLGLKHAFYTGYSGCKFPFLLTNAFWVETCSGDLAANFIQNCIYVKKMLTGLST